MPIEREVGARVGERGRGDVDGGDAAGAGERRVHGEAAGVAEQVDHLDAGGERADGAAVLALIEEEAGLLPVEHVDGEAHAVLADLDGRRRRAAVQHLAAAAARALEHVGDAERAPSSTTAPTTASRQTRTASPSRRRTATGP